MIANRTSDIDYEN